MSYDNPGQAEQADIWQATLDVGNTRVDTGAYTSSFAYRHAHDQATEAKRPIATVDVPMLWPTSTGSAVVPAGYSSGGHSTSSNDEDGRVWAIFSGSVGFVLALPLIAWALGVLASRIVPWAHGVLEVGHLTGWFGPKGWLIAGLFAAALIGQWIVTAAAVKDAQDPIFAFVVVALTLFAATEAVKAALIFAYAPDFQCRANFAWIAQTCSADVWSFAKSAMSWTGLASVTGLAAWAVTVMTALIYVLVGTLLQALVVAPAVAILEWLD